MNELFWWGLAKERRDYIFGTDPDILHPNNPKFLQTSLGKDLNSMSAFCFYLFVVLRHVQQPGS